MILLGCVSLPSLQYLINLITGSGVSHIKSAGHFGHNRNFVKEASTFKYKSGLG